jgi:hypothetical protein
VKHVFGDSGRRYLPEVFVASCWLLLFAATTLFFRDDESVGHRAAHLGLWLSLAFYVTAAIRDHRSTGS